ncbi:MAG: amidohydrolase, partial [Pseudomonadales bacterium]|nr:amidohydrolase [Pseudomonadales bacterium]
MSTTAKPLYFDCDNHFYESAESFLRYLPEKYKKALRFIELDGRTKMLVNGKLSEYIPNPTFEVVAAPGSTVEYFKGNNPEGKSYRDFMQVQRCIDEYRVKTPKRYELLAEHGLCGTLMFPTLASVVESHMYEDPGLCHAMIHSLNQWMLDEWGFGEDGQFYATPVITLMDAEKALEEAKWIVSKGSKVVLMRPSYVPGKFGNRGMGSSEFDPIYELLAANDIIIAFHNSDNGVFDMYERHKKSEDGLQGEYQPFKKSDPLEMVMDLNQATVGHNLAGLVCHGVFDRHPNLKVCYVETGVAWLYPMWDRLEHVYNMAPQLFSRHPHDIIRDHVWFHPHFEENVSRLVDMVGVDHIIFGSDWPHPEGLARPGDWIQALDGLSDEDKDKIMRTNMMGLLG